MCIIWIYDLTCILLRNFAIKLTILCNARNQHEKQLNNGHHDIKWKERNQKTYNSHLKAINLDCLTSIKSLQRIFRKSFIHCCKNPHYVLFNFQFVPSCYRTTRMRLTINHCQYNMWSSSKRRKFSNLKKLYVSIEAIWEMMNVVLIILTYFIMILLILVVVIFSFFKFHKLVI